MRLLTARLAPKELATLKSLMLRPGFVEEWNSLDALAAGFAKVLLAKENATPSTSFKLFISYDPEAVLWLGFTSKDPAVKERFNLFLKVWPELRLHIPHALLQEMRITDELPAYRQIVDAVFLELLDGRLATPEEARAFLEPHSPPAPPPQVTIKRPRAKRGAEAKLKEHSFDDDEDSEEGSDEDDDLNDIGGDDDDLDLGLHLPKVDLDADLTDESDSADDEDEDEDVKQKPSSKSAPVKHNSKSPAQAKSAPSVEAGKLVATPVAPKPAKAEKLVPAQKAKLPTKPESKPAVLHPAKVVPAAVKPHVPTGSPKSQPAPVKVASAHTKKPVPQVKLAPKKLPAKAPAKPPVKTPLKPQAHKPVATKPVAAKKKPAPVSKPKVVKSKLAVKKPVSKPAKKR